MDEEISNKIQIFLDLFDEIAVKKDEMISEMSEYDKKLSAMYHKIEGMKLGHIAESHLLLKELQKLLRERREIKINVRILQAFYNNFTPKIDKYKETMENIIEQHNQILKEIEKKSK
jgi:uncharacterized coiled-coil DUF342 family protein